MAALFFREKTLIFNEKENKRRATSATNSFISCLVKKKFYRKKSDWLCQTGHEKTGSFRALKNFVQGDIKIKK